MIHLREDYNAIQAWPTKRPHHCLDNGTGTRIFNAVTEDGTLPLIPEDEPVFCFERKMLQPRLLCDDGLL